MKRVVHTPSVRHVTLALRTYLVECFSPGVDRAAVEAAAARAAAAAAELRIDGVPVEYLQALLVADDEVVFHLFASDGPSAVCEASVRAGVPFERIVESVAVDPPSPAGDGRPEPGRAP